jgi:cytochrome c peroxidase
MGPTLSDDRLHDIGVPALADHAVDPGLTQEAVDEREQSVFNAAGPFYDGGPVAVTAPTPVLGAFRTPSLRNVRGSAPYGHDGVFASLEEVVDFHLSGGGRDASTFAGSVDPALVPRDVSAQDRAALIEFLEALDGDYPSLPWRQWPNGNG